LWPAQLLTGLTSRELLGILRGLAGMPLVGADVVEVSPAYDHAEMTTVAAAHVCYELLALLALAGAGRAASEPPASGSMSQRPQ
jgi:agmatinase